jgi:hypothetical protein
MQDEHENVLILSEGDYFASEEWSPGQIKGRRGIGPTYFFGLAITRVARVVAEINSFQLEVQTIQYPLLGSTLLAGEHGAQILMPRDDQIERFFQLAYVKLATDGDCYRDVVDDAVGIHLVDKPQSFLGEAQRQPLELRPVDTFNRRDVAFCRLADQLG